jgi:choice-of-anchor C domain-containing protein
MLDGDWSSDVCSSDLEEPGLFGASYATYDFLSSPNAITGWTIGFGSVDLIQSYWQPSEGKHSLDLSGNGPGMIFQTIATTIGQQYRLSFDLAGNPDASGLKTTILNVTAGVTPQAFSFTNDISTTKTSMAWVSKSLDFVATKNDTTIMFMSGNSSAFGPALDNVSVTAVPEPETYAMMLAGLGLVAGMARRKRKQA